MSENPSRESITYDMSEILRREHDIHGSKQITFDSVNNALINMTKFYLEPTNFDEKIPYQYQKENQAIFENNQVIISSSLHQVDTVLTEMKTKMYQLEKNQHQVMYQGMPEPLPVATPETKEKKSILPSFSKPKPIKLNPNDPYQSSIDLQKKTTKLIEDWDLVVEWQSEGVEYDGDFDKIAYENYLSTHRHIFRKEVEPNLMRVYSQGLQLVLMKEKELALQLASGQMKEMFQTRNDFQM
jgi:hypothetical protein